MADKKQDLRLELADRLIEQIEQGTARWQRPWEAGEVELAVNAVTGKPYRGVNQEFLLMLSPDPSDPRWMTLKQANAQGWSIKEGEHGVPIEKWTEYQHKLTAEEKQKLLEDGLEPKDKEKRMGVKYYSVFHASQIEGIPPIERPERTFETQGTLDDRLPRLAEAMGVDVEHVGGRAFYRKSTDRVTMPPVDAFEKAAGHDTVLLHELSHATGHESRLGRDLTGIFGSEKYALEELRAEMSAAMTAASLGIGFDPASQSLEEGREENSAAYLASWLRKLPEKERKQAILGAVKDAQGISDYLLDRTPERDRTTLDLGIKEAKELPDFATIEQDGFTVSQNKGKAGLEVKFTEKPEQEVLDGLKAGGFRWSRKEGLWYARDTEKSRETLVNVLHVDDKALGMSANTLDPELVDYLKQQTSMDDDQTRVSVAQDHVQKDPDKASEWAVLLRGDPHGYAKAVGRDDVEADTMRGAATLLEETVKREQQKILDKEDRKVREIQGMQGLREIPESVLPFLGGDQLAATRDGLKGEEKAFFSDKMRELETIIQQMPETYETDGKPDHEKPVSLRYFGPGNSQWFIIEKDRGDPANRDMGQKQAFGLADLGQGEPEMGYINIEEITRHGVELDYHFERTNLLEIKKAHYPEMVRHIALGESLKEPEQAVGTRKPAPRLVATLKLGHERYDATIDESGTGKLAVTLGDNKQVMPLQFIPGTYTTAHRQEKPCLRASAEFDDGVKRDVTLFPDLGHKNVLAIFAEQNPGQKRQPIAAAELLKPNKAAQEQGLPQGTVDYLKKTLGVDLNAQQKAKKGPEIA